MFANNSGTNYAIIQQLNNMQLYDRIVQHRGAQYNQGSQATGSYGAPSYFPQREENLKVEVDSTIIDFNVNYVERWGT